MHRQTRRSSGTWRRVSMIWIVLAALGVPIWLIVGALGGALWSRRKFRQAPGVFPCKVRIHSGSGGPGTWSRTTTYAAWVHDVLLVHVGLALIRIRAFPIAEAAGPISPARDVKVKGGDAISIRLHLDDGSIAEVAGPASMRDTLAGPFVVLRDATTETSPT
jgi:hypothetical protein